MSNWTADGAIEHHGILGQKWGVRRFQNKDGSWTPAGEDRYGADGSDSPQAPSQNKEKKKSKLRQKYEAAKAKDFKRQYKMTDEEAKAAAEKRADLMKKVAIGAGVAVGAATAIYAARQIGRNYCDEVIKSGKMLQNLSDSDDIVNRGKAFYASYRGLDNAKYRGAFGINRDGTFKNVNQIKATKDLKIASTRNAKKVFDDLVKNDRDFSDSLDKLHTKMGPFARIERNNYGKTAYDKFNAIDLMSNSKEADEVKEKFFDALKKKGYSGLHDINDRKYSGYNTKATILFDKSGLNQVASKKLTQKQVNAGKAAFTAAYNADVYSHPAVIATGAAAISAIVVNSDNNRMQAEARRKQYEKRAKQNSNSNTGQAVGTNTSNRTNRKKRNAG